MRTPILLLLDSILSRDVGAIESTLRTMRKELPPEVVATYLPPTITTTSCHSMPAIVQHLSIYLQTFPQLASIGSTHDASLPLHFAASLGDAVVAQIVWQAYPLAVVTPIQKGKIPLHYASREGHAAVVQFFLQVAPQTAAMASGKDKLALHFAAGEGHLEVVRALLRVYPQSASLPSAKGKVPLHFCSRWGHEAVAMELLPYYPDAIRALDWEGSLPLHEACREGQDRMARFLVERFPEGLATANLRNEVPLFPAVRSGGSLEMILNLLQAWPAGAAHVLQLVTVDDRIATWGPAVVEALLRASVECWEGFAPWLSQPPPTLRLYASVNHVLPQENDDEHDTSKANKAKKKKDKKDKKEKKDKVKSAKSEKSSFMDSEDLIGSIEDRQPRLWTAGPFTSTRVERMSHPPSLPDTSARTPRSKSPILEETDETTVRPSKRVRRSIQHPPNSEFEENEESQTNPSSALPPVGRVFYPWHAALTVKASLPVLRHVQQIFPDVAASLDKKDHQNRTVLHLAMQHGALAREDKPGGGVDWILKRLLFHSSTAMATATREHTRGALPLHDALQNRASSRLIDKLLKANPSSAVEACGTRDEWRDEKPLALACQSNCDHSTVYLLLRADPSVISSTTDTTTQKMAAAPVRARINK